MPTNRRRRLQPRRSTYHASPRVMLLLLTGHDFGFLDPALGPEGGLPEDFLQEAWRDCGEQVMDFHRNGYADNELAGGVAGEAPQAGNPWGYRFETERN